MAELLGIPVWKPLWKQTLPKPSAKRMQLLLEEMLTMWYPSILKTGSFQNLGMSLM